MTYGSDRGRRRTLAGGARPGSGAPAVEESTTYRRSRRRAAQERNAYQDFVTVSGSGASPRLRRSSQDSSSSAFTGELNRNPWLSSH